MTDNTKYYTIPTRKWLKPIESLIEKEIGLSGILILSERIGKDKVMVKITKGHNKLIEKINKLIKHEPNCVRTYNTILCYEDRDKIKNLYKNSDGFCNSDIDDGRKITLEVMYRYRSSLNKYHKRLLMKQYIEIIKQLLLVQTHLFQKYGIIHNDIHEGNILVKRKHDVEKEMIYKIKNKDYKLRIIFEIVLCDFDKSIIYDKKITDEFDKEYLWMNNSKLNPDKNDYTMTLIKNLIDTIKNTIHLLHNEDYEKHSKRILDSINNEKLKSYIDFCESDMRSFLRKERTFEDFKERAVNKGVVLTNHICNILEEKDKLLIK